MIKTLYLESTTFLNLYAFNHIALRYMKQKLRRKTNQQSLRETINMLQQLKEQVDKKSVCI